VIQVQEAFWTLKQTTSEKKHRHITVKILNIQNKERILEAAREKWQVILKANPSE
jgi:hypothetical protein